MVGEKPARPAGRRFTKIADDRERIPSKEFPTYWIEALDDLMEAYDRICAYSCFRVHEITGARSVDHFAAKSLAWDKVYEWSNYRLVCSRLNARKNDFGDVLDPFEIGDGWFELELVGFQVVPAADLDDKTRDRVQETIDRLTLNDFMFRRERERDAEKYWERDSLQTLEEESPFVAKELRRQGRLKPGDV
jgi:hypothetical protein